jgi:hypothetical protein
VDLLVTPEETARMLVTTLFGIDWNIAHWEMTYCGIWRNWGDESIEK